MNSPAYFEIQASNPEKLISFYQTLFGWIFTPQPGTPVPYWQIETEGIRGGLLERPMAVPSQGQGTNAYVCSMEVANFDEMSANILAAGGQIAMPKFVIPGKCWQGYFLDLDNNTFGIFEVDELAK